jgi:competence protein ComEC
MFTWSPFPFVRIISALIFGILLAKQEYIKIEYEHYLIYTSIALIVLLFAFKISKFKFRLVFSGNLGLLVIIIVGVLRYWDYSQINNENHLLNATGEIEGYIAKVNSSHQEKEKYFVYEIDILSILQDENIAAKSGKINLYVRKSSDSIPSLKYGDKIIISLSPFKLPPPKNPHEFNYIDYMADRNIYFQQFVDEDEVKIIGHSPAWKIMDYAIELRGYFARTIEENVSGIKEQAIAKALVLGIRDDLDNQVKRSFSSAGAMHVLAVSGLHVGIIIGIISFLLKPLVRLRNGRLFSAFISLCCLWLYAMIAGLSPSILRASTMFSIMIIGQAFGSRQNIYNSLALSAAILLFLNPNNLFSVGFQLSYLAVLGIVYIYPLIHRKLIFSNFIFEQMWSITCLSIAAQLATFPLTLYYFHQFPVYFLISNLIVIPAAMLIMIIGILLLIVSSSGLASIIGTALNGVIYSLHSIVTYIEQLDFSLIDWLYLSPIHTFLIYLMILSILALLHYRQVKFAYSIVYLSIILSLTGLFSILKQKEKQELVFYEIDGESVFDKIEGLHSELIEINPIQNPELVRFQVEPNRLNSHLQKIDVDAEPSPLLRSNQPGILYYSWEGKTFIFLTEESKDLRTKEKIVTDYLVISNNSTSSLEYLQSNFSFKELIIDGSNDYKTCKKFEISTKKENIKCRILRDKGSLTISL